MNSCKDKHLEKRTYVANVPVYESYENFRKSIKVSSPRVITEAGKIYFKDNYLFISNPNKGIHVINNIDPSSPQSIVFIEVPGNVDMAIKDNLLYVDSYIDLVVIDISDPLNATEVGRLEDAFPEKLPPANPDYPIANIDPDLGVVVDFIVEEITEYVEVDVMMGNRNRLGLKSESNWDPASPGDQRISTSTGSQGNFSATSTGTGIAGSLAQFTIKGNTLFSVFNRSMYLYDISNSTKPVEDEVIYLGWEVETIFPKDNNLFLGTKSGMVIYDISSPGSPEYISRISHIRSCDPVVVEGDYAYVTLRNGSSCWGTVNELQVIDISDLYNPYLIASYPMHEPYGLGIDNNVLFICDGDEGLKIYDATDPYNITNNHLNTFDINGYDVIPLNDVLMTIADDGLYQYDYSNKSSISLLGTIIIDK
ncbi:MAG: hypothetical protein IH948_05720 [Bacteroidetes bacterium]|nr:hypothetical protein [Bacteroidota bacterium]